MKAIANLKEYVKIDDEIIDKKEESDFTKFCDKHCESIMAVVDCVEQIAFAIESLDSCDFFDRHDYLIVKDYLKENILPIIEDVLD